MKVTPDNQTSTAFSRVDIYICDRAIRKEKNPMYFLIHNQAGHALAIAQEPFHILHLDVGTKRNEENAKRVVDVLNAAEACVDNPAWAGICDEDVALEQAVKQLRGY